MLGRATNKIMKTISPSILAEGKALSSKHTFDPASPSVTHHQPGFPTKTESDQPKETKRHYYICTDLGYTKMEY
ncbi:hypothetical protein AKO1_001357 [Acrasis kona]|uniref:Uncharacterized protein n=1 Tax=Acrasis kona TaxID=1008807 RepID=A0AAW2ZCE0_9EUKA